MQPTKTTPRTNLLTRKAGLQEQCRIQEQKLEKDFAYLREHSGGLLLSGLSGLLSSGPKTAPSPTRPSAASGQSPPLRLADVLSIGKEMLPVAWEIAQPFLITWSIQKIKRWIQKPKNQPPKT
ncbi:MAG: hypothetical protein LBT83_03280 [Tannerella sp.]|jgi:hypothetical protein|nr:hypothetical protein [Tannerella sp.]